MDGHLIFKELNNFHVDIALIPKGIVNRHIAVIDSLQ